MKIKKYRPSYFSGFEDEYYEVNSVEELLNSDLCKWEVENGFVICFDFKDNRPNYFQSYLMSVRENSKSEHGCEWWVVALIKEYDVAKTLKDWLPDFNTIVENYKRKGDT